MPQIIDVPGMGRVEFPDGMTDEQIVAAIQRNAPKQAAQSQPNPEAMNPEVVTPMGSIKGELPGGFNPAAALIKAGEVLSNVNQGVAQAKFGPADWIRQKLGGAPDPMMQKIEADRADAKQPMKDLAAVHPGSALIGEAATYMVAPNKAAPVLAAAEYGGVGDRVMRGGAAFLGNKIGEKIGQGVGRVAQPTRPAEISQTQRLANEAADRLGVKLSAGEASGNRALKWAESASADMPIASGMATRRVTANQKAMNQAVLRQLGQSGDEITEGVLAKARTDIGGEYDRILAPAKITLDNSFRQEVKAIGGSKVMRQLSKDMHGDSVGAMLDQFRNMPQGKIKVSGEWFQQNKSALDDAVRSAYQTGQTGKARALEQFEKALDRAAMRSLPDADKAAYKAAQKQWATLRGLEAGKVVENGNVMPGRLNSYLETRYKGAYKEGKIKGDVADVARLGLVLRGLPQSGSTPRAVYSGMAGGAALLEPTTALTMLAGPASVQALTTSKAMRKYMEKGLMNITPEMEKRLMLMGGKGGLLGYAGLMD